MKMLFLLLVSGLAVAEERTIVTTGQDFDLLDNDPYRSEQSEQMRNLMQDELNKLFANDLQYENCQIALEQYPDQRDLSEFAQTAGLNAGNYKVVIRAPGEISEAVDADARIWPLKVAGGWAETKYLPPRQELRLGETETTLKLVAYRAIRKKKLNLPIVTCIPLMGETCPTHKTVGYIERTLTLKVTQQQVTAFELTDKYYRRLLTSYLPYKEKTPLTCQQ